MVLNLKVARTARGFTQWDISELIAISASKYSLIERGKLAPTDEERERLAQIFEKPAATLLRQVGRVRPAHSAAVGQGEGRLQDAAR